MSAHHSHTAEIVGTLLATGIAWMGKQAALHDLHTIGLSLLCAGGGWLLTKWLESNYGHKFKKKDKKTLPNGQLPQDNTVHQSLGRWPE